jgi:4-hydroxy-3-polyprenylbenzoate decarboxylase
MLAATESGAVIMPPVPAFYTRPQTISDLVDHSVGRALDAFGLSMPGLPRWGVDVPASDSHSPIVFEGSES